jgi:hypothetical protein
VQETPQEHFLNAKARFQKHYDEEDAAELLFACNNLINHGIELDWDNTLQKMEDILKEKAKVDTKTALAEDEKDVPKPQKTRRDYGPDIPDLIGTDYYATDISPDVGGSRRRRTGGGSVRTKANRGIKRENIDFASLRNYKTAPIDFKVSNSEMQRLRDAKVPGARDDLLSYLSMLSSHKDQAGEGIFQHIATADEQHLHTLAMDRPKSTYEATGDEHAFLGLFHENTLSPNLYHYLVRYYDPRSPYFVEKADKWMDDHDRNIVTQALGIDDQTLRRNPNAWYEEMEKKSPEERARLNKELGHVSPDMLGPVPEMMRTRLYERAFSKWDDWYQNTYPDSPLLGEDQSQKRLRQALFIQHKMLKLDGCKLGYIQDALYEENGEQSRDYLNIIRRDDFNDKENRDPKMAMGTRPLEYGLEMLDSDPSVEDLSEMKTCLALMSGQISHELDKVHNKEETVNLEPDWESAFFHDEGQYDKDDFFDSNFRSTTNYGGLEFFFKDGDPVSAGFTVKEMLSHMVRSQYVMTRAYSDGWTGHHSIPNNQVQRTSLGKNPNVWKESMKRALNEAHAYFTRDMTTLDEDGKIVANEKGEKVREGNTRARATGVRLSATRPIFAKIRDFFDAREEFDEDEGLPVGADHSYSNFQDVKKTLEHWLKEGAIDTDEASQLAEFLAIENGGYGEATDAFRDWKAHHHSKAWPLIYPVEPSDMREGELDKLHSEDGVVGKSPYWPTLTLFSREGGLNLDITDPLNIYLQRNPDLGREVKQSMMELSDLEELPKGFKERTKKGADLRKERLPQNWPATKEFFEAYASGSTLNNIYDNPQQYPLLNRLLTCLISRKGVNFNADGPDAETEISEDKSSFDMKHDSLLDTVDGLDWLVKRGLTDRQAAILAHPIDNYKPMVPIGTTKDKEEGEMTKRGVAIGATAPGRRNPVGANGGAHGSVPHTGKAMRGMGSMISPERSNRALDRIKLPLDIINALTLGAEGRQNLLAGETESRFERRLAQITGEQGLLERLEMLDDDLQFARVFSVIGGDTQLNHNPQNNFTLRPFDSHLATKVRQRHSKDVITGSDGDGTVQESKNRRNFNIFTRNKEGVPTQSDIVLSDMARLQATLWGLAGATPLKYGGVNVLSNPAALNKLLQELRGANRSGKSRKDISQDLLFHPSPFFGSENLSNMFNALFKKPIAATKDWRATIEGMGQHEAYLYPVEEENGRYYLKLEPLSEGGGKAHLHIPDVSQARKADAKSLQDFSEKNKNIEGTNPRRMNEFLLELTKIGDESGPYNYVDIPTDKLKFQQQQEQRAYSNRMEISPEHLVDEGKETFMVASHPSELLSNWSESVFSFLPRTSDVVDAMHATHEKAKDSALNDIGSLPIEVSDERDTYTESGFTMGALAEIIKAEHDFAMAMSNGGILPALAYVAIEDAKKNPTEYQDRDSLSEKVSHLLQERLAINGDAIPAGSSEDYDRRARFQKVMEMGHTYLNNDGGYKRGLLEKMILNNASPDEKDEWEQSLQRVNETVAMSSARHNTVANVSYEEPTPLHSLDNKGRKDIYGYEILYHYLVNDPRVQEIANALGKNTRSTKTAVRDLIGLVNRADHKVESTQEANDILGEMGHHAKGEKPLSWRPRAYAYDPENPERPVSAKGKKTKPSIWEEDLLDRATDAARAKKLAGIMSKVGGSQKSLREAEEEYALFFTRVNGKSIFDIIEDDIDKTKQQNGKHALPEIVNALQHNRGSSIEERNKAFASFLFCNSRFKEPTPLPKFEHTAAPIAMGHPSGVPRDQTSLKNAKYSSLYKNPWFKRFFGVHHRESDTIPDEHTSKDPQTFLPMHPEIVNNMVSGLPRIHSGITLPETPLYSNMPEGQSFGVRAAQPDQRDELMLSLDVLTDTDLFFKSEKKDDGTPTPVKAMHRIFSLKDLDHLRGFSGDWVASAWPRGERLIIEKLKTKIKVHNSKNDDFSLPNSILEGIKEASDPKFMIDAIWDKDTLHIVDIIGSGDEKMENMPSKDRIRHLRAQFAASDGVMIPAPINTKRVDSEGLERAVKDLLAEKGVKQVLLRDADSTYMRGESRHPKWVLLTPEKSFDVMVLESRGNTHRIGIGPLFDEEGKALGNRATRCKGEYYMDVGSVHHSGLEVGQHITVKVPSVTSQNRKKMRVYNLNGARYLRDSEAKGTDSIETLDIACQTPNPNVPHKVRINKGVIHLEFPETHVSFETERIGHSFLLKQADFGSDYDLKLAESQREYWSPLAAVLLRSEAEAEKMVEEKKPKKAHVVPEPPANHTKKPKKVLKPAENIMKDPEITKQVVSALELLDEMLKEKVTFTGPKGLGIDFASPIESPSGPTTLTEPKNLPDHDPGHRESKGGACWCGAKRGQECEQGLATKMEDCPKFSPPHKEKDDNHVKIPVS